MQGQGRQEDRRDRGVRLERRRRQLPLGAEQHPGRLRVPRCRLREGQQGVEVHARGPRGAGIQGAAAGLRALPDRLDRGLHGLDSGLRARRARDRLQLRTDRRERDPRRGDQLRQDRGRGGRLAPDRERRGRLQRARPGRRRLVAPRAGRGGPEPARAQLGERDPHRGGRGRGQ